MKKKALSILAAAASLMARWGAVGTTTCIWTYQPELPRALREEE